MVVITWPWVATQKGVVPGFPATGKRIKMSGATVYYLDAGRLAGHWQITDRLGVFMQLRQGLAST
jgi:predicted ester cyclase